MHGYIRAAAHRNTDIGSSQRRRVIHAVTHHAHGVAPTLFTSCDALPPEGLVCPWRGPGQRLAPACVFARLFRARRGILEREHSGRLLARQHLSHDLVGRQTQAFAHGQRRAPVVARNHEQPNTALAQRLQGIASARLGLVAESQQRPHHHGPGHPLGQSRNGLPLSLPLRGRPLQRTQPGLQFVHPAQTAHQPGPARNIALGATPGHGPHLGRRLHTHAALLGRRQYRAGQRMFAAALQAGRRLEQRGLVLALCHPQCREPGPPYRQGAGLVECQCVKPVRQLQRFSILDQNTVPGRDAGAGHDGCRRCQSQGTRTGDHHHGDGMNQRHFKSCPERQPAQQRGQRNQQHHRHKHRRHLVHQALHRRLGGLRIFYQADDAGQHGFSAHRTHLHHDTALAIDAAPGQLVTGLLGYRQWLAGQHRLIDLGLPFQQQAIDRDALAGPDHQPVVHKNLGHR